MSLFIKIDDKQWTHPTNTYRLLVCLQREFNEQGKPDGVYVYCPALPGALSQGETIEEALENIKEALQGCIYSYIVDGMEIPWVRNPDGTIRDDPIVDDPWELKRSIIVSLGE